MDPIIRLVKNIMDGNKEGVMKIIGQLGITLSKEEEELT